MILPKFSRWIPSYRHAVYWLGFALACFTLYSVLIRTDPAGPWLGIPLGFAVLASFATLIGSSIFSCWRLRRSGRLALTALAAPIIGITVLVFVLATIWVLFGVTAWSSEGTDDFSVVQVLPSPDGSVKAIHAEDLSGGPMTGTSEDVYLVGASKFPAKPTFLAYQDRAFSIECIHDLNMRWTAPHTLQIDYSVIDGSRKDKPFGPQPLPIFHGQQDDWKRTDPVKVIVFKHVTPGPFC